MPLLKTLKFIVNHPLNKNGKNKAIVRFLKWQLFSTFFSYPVVYPFVENTKLIIKKGMTGATGNMYCGLHEFEDMSFVLHFLRAEDLFFDIGANIGSYTILAAGVCGSRTVSIEPIPDTFYCLKQNILINELYDKVEVTNIGIGSSQGILKFTKATDTTNHVATKSDTDTIDVMIDSLDNIAKNETPVLIKMDVEGFETEIIKGGTETLKSEKLKAIIIELNGSGNRYGFDEKKIHAILLANGFKPYCYEPFKRNLVIQESFGNQNTIYLRDIDFVLKRIQTAGKFKVFNLQL
jgi:FkbM family methyltransferase